MTKDQQEVTQADALRALQNLRVFILGGRDKYRDPYALKVIDDGTEAIADILRAAQTEQDAPAKPSDAQILACWSRAAGHLRTGVTAERVAFARELLAKYAPSRAGPPQDSERLREALERTLNNFRLMLAQRPVRDAAETIAEAESALSQATASRADDVHSCSYFCTRPECVMEQRDYLRDRFIRGGAV